jgi:hypothetical protein
MKSVTIFILAWVAVQPAQAQDCESYVGQSIQPQNIDEVMARFSRIQPKGEFESTADYQARVARLTAGTGRLIIGKVPDGENPYDRAGRGHYFRYDADRQVMRVISYAFDNANFNERDIWGYGGPLYQAGDYTSRSYNVDVVISENRRTTGSYRGTNAFGVSAQVVRTASTMNVIYERPLRSYAEGGLFGQRGGTNDPLAEIPVSPGEAMRLKNSMLTAFVVVPQPPFYVEHTGRPSRPTIGMPEEVTRTTRVLFADIQCALLTDSGNRVLAAFRTQ